MEWPEQTDLADSLEELLDEICILWMFIENMPWSQLADILQEKHGVGSGYRAR